MGRALVVAAAAVAALVPLPRTFVERAYSTGFYSAIQPAVTGMSNRVSLALFDVLLVGATVLFVVAIVAAIWRRRGWWRTLGALSVSTATVAAVLYLAFLLMWGWNYRRVPVADRLDYDRSRVTPSAAVAAARAAVGALDRLYDPAHAGGWTTPGLIDPSLASAFAEVQRALGAKRLAIPARPKATILGVYFRRTGVSGMTDPYFLETLVDDTLLPFERPHVVAHEWAHLAGYADEGEANFVGWLTCIQAGAPEQYSGWLFLWGELARSVPPTDRDALRAALGDGVRRDLAAIAERLKRNINPALASAGWRVYDRYLKANRVPEGAASYDTVVRLVLGVKFAEGWRPQRR